jgi:DNA polymerase-3 subunit gamma/tau
MLLGNLEWARGQDTHPMSYEVVARRWRPNTFASVVGQRHVTATLENAIERDRVAHAFLFTGIRGVGKTTVARLLARALNCSNRQDGAEPCNECPSCTAALEGSSVDVLEIDGASNRGIDEIRSLIDASGYRPAIGPYRIYIIDEVHQLTKEAFNALLKILEEPPDHLKFIMATTEAHKLPATVLSRCQRYDFRRLSLDEILDQLSVIVKKDDLDVAPEAMSLIAREAEGSMRDAQSLLEQVVAAVGGKVTVEETTALLGLAGLEQVERCVEAVLDGDAAAVVGVTRELGLGGFDAERLLSDILDLLRHVTIAASAGPNAVSDRYGESTKATAGRLASKRSPLDLQRIFSSLLNTASDLRRGVDPELVLEMGLLKAAALENVESVGQVLAEVRRIAAGGAGGGGGQQQRRAPGRTDSAPARTQAPPKRSAPQQSEPARSAEARPPEPPAPGAPVQAAAASVARQADEQVVRETPTAAPDPPSATVDSDEARWEGFLAKVREACGLDLYVTLTNCEVSQWTDELLELRPTLGSFRRKLDNQAAMGRVGEVARTVLGENVEVRIAGEGEKPQTEAISVQKIESNKTTRLEKEALEDPLVRKTLEVLGGKVESISRVDE